MEATVRHQQSKLLLLANVWGNLEYNPVIKGVQP